MAQNLSGTLQDMWLHVKMKDRQKQYCNGDHIKENDPEDHHLIRGG